MNGTRNPLLLETRGWSETTYETYTVVFSGGLVGSPTRTGNRGKIFSSLTPSLFSRLTLSGTTKVQILRFRV